MKKILLLTIFTLLIFQNAWAAQSLTETYSVKNKFGLIKDGQKITEAKYTKLIRLGESSYLFMYKNKYGIMSDTGEVLIEPKFTQAQRYVSKYAKLGAKGLWSLYDETGMAIIDHEYSSIDILYGKMFLVGKNYKYGLISFEGDIILAPVADDIYMPKPNILKIQYDGDWYEIEQKGTEMDLAGVLPEFNDNNTNFKITQIIDQPIVTTGYGIVSASDYFIKLFSSVSPAYEQTIDELILNHGADTATILIKSGWLLKFPFVYGKNYINNVKAPNNGPLSDVKSNLKNKMKS